MADQFTETVTTGWGKRIMNSFMGVLIGILLFFFSFVVLWKTEGRTNYAKIAGKAVALSTQSVDQNGQDQLVSATGALETPDSVGDPEFLRPGSYIMLQRTVEMYAWRERSSSKSEKKMGGSETTTTTYTYEKEWTSNPENSAEFKKPEGHANPGLDIAEKEFYASQAKLGAYELDIQNMQLPDAPKLEIGQNDLSPEMPDSFKLSQGYLFKGKGTLSEPEVGDIRLSFGAIASGKKVTVFGKLIGGAIEPYMIKGETKFYRAMAGTRDEAIAQLKAEYKMTGWIGRIIGFLMMWIGMLMLLGPLHTVLDVLPFLGTASRFVVGLMTFPIALVLSLVTIIVSMIAHNIIALVIVLALVAGGILFLMRKKKQPVAQAAVK
ncbi:TMEM43 family protein [candidate division TA06 bacterium]|nr:TMEM43 family protein [candidate division TA06 bacterium]